MIAIIDYGAGNLRSVEKALTAIGEESIVTRDRHEILNADKVILPGVGAFGDAMNSLKKYELDKVIHEVCDMDKPFLAYAWDFSYYLREAMRVRALRVFMCLTDRYFAYQIRKDLKYLT